VSRKKEDFHYLLPGQGRGARKRFLRNLVVALIVGIIASGLFAGVVYLIQLLTL
jgi:hypothetical protein